MDFNRCKSSSYDTYHTGPDAVIKHDYFGLAGVEMIVNVISYRNVENMEAGPFIGDEDCATKYEKEQVLSIYPNFASLNMQFWALLPQCTQLLHEQMRLRNEE